MIYRGAGIIVPIIVFAIGWIVSFWFKDTTLGNANYIAWTALYSFIPLLLAGIGLLGSSRNGKKHDFFFIPVIFWAIAVGGICVYAFVSPWRTGREIQAQAMEKSMPVHNIHFYNPLGDTMRYLLADLSYKGGSTSEDQVDPYRSVEVMAVGKSFLLSSLDNAGEAYMTLPNPGDFNKSKYKVVKKDKDVIYQLILPEFSGNSNVYESLWMLMDENYNMIAVDISGLYDATKLESSNIAKTDWTKQIAKQYKGTELIEVRLKASGAANSVVVTDPDRYIPSAIEAKQSAYVLIVHHKDQALTNAFLAEQLEGFIETPAN